MTTEITWEYVISKATSTFGSCKNSHQFFYAWNYVNLLLLKMAHHPWIKDLKGVVSNIAFDQQQLMWRGGRNKSDDD